MKSKIKPIFYIAVLLCVAACNNTILEKFWDNPANTAEPTELYVDGVLKMKARLPAILAWIKSNTVDNTYYTIQVGTDDSLLPNEGLLLYPDKTGVTICLAGKNIERIITITDNAAGSLFEVGKNITLVLKNITLKGHDKNNRALITVSSRGTLILKDGAIIRDNIVSAAVNSPGITGGGIKVEGILIMEGGQIMNNKSNDEGGGIYVYPGTFRMNDGFIYGNEAGLAGGGVCVRGVFTMQGGVISNNRVTGKYNGTWIIGGGGVCVYSGNLTKTGGIIGANNVVERYYGGGDAVFAYHNSSAKVRNRTLGEYDTISTENWTIGWE